MSTSAFDCPVLLLVFNRPYTALRVFEQIRKIRPKYLFVAADGPRENVIEDYEKCELTRSAILNAIDWDCEVKTLFRTKNLGCGHAPVDAITWFFEQVEYGIVLEDDCLPALSFFIFCNELLLKYKNDQQVMAISGTNLLESHDTSSSYCFSALGGNWGWASWKRAWKHYDFTIEKWKDKTVRQRIRNFIDHEKTYAYYASIFNEHSNNARNDIWDYQWLFCRLMHGGLSIIPSYNQISNIGFGADATHTFDPENRITKLKVEELSFPIQHPGEIAADKKFDQSIYEIFLKPAILKNTVYKKLRRLVTNFKF